MTDRPNKRQRSDSYGEGELQSGKNSNSKGSANAYVTSLCLFKSSQIQYLVFVWPIMQDPASHPNLERKRHAACFIAPSCFPVQ